MLNQKALPLITKAAEKGYGIIARMALQFGLLTGKFDKEVSFAPNDHRKNRLTSEVIETANKALTPLWALCEKYNCSKTQLALSFVLSYPGVSTIIPGIRTAEQVHLNTTGLFSLEPEDLQLIEKIGTTDFVPVLDLIQRQG
jgi:aryl-alcohol dehydrogenase-like predicted oxidoreductase